MLPVAPEQVCLVSNRAQLFVRSAERNHLGQELRIERHQSDFTESLASNFYSSAQLRSLLQ